MPPWGRARTTGPARRGRAKRQQRFNMAPVSCPAMRATGGPRGPGRPQSIEFYADPAMVPGPAVLSPKSDLVALSRASSAGPREAMEWAAARVSHPDGEAGLPDIQLDFAYVRSAAIPLFDECCSLDEATQELPVRLWRFRASWHGGAAVEVCFRAVMHRMSARREGRGARICGTFTVLDARPFVEWA